MKAIRIYGFGGPEVLSLRRRKTGCAGRKKLRIPPERREVERADQETRNQPDDNPTGEANLNHCLSPG